VIAGILRLPAIFLRLKGCSGMKMPRLKYWLLVIPMGAVCLWLIVYPSHQILALEDPDSGELLCYMPVADGDHFQIKYTHSIHLSDVHEEYRVQAGRLYPYQLIYEDTGVGMPANAEAGQTFTMKDGKYIISNLQGSTDKLYLTIGAVKANHQIIYNDISYSLQDNIGPGETIAIKTRNVNNWMLWKGDRLHE
jgi:hypothetical protein